MSCPYSRVKYSGTAPIADASNYMLFSSTVAFPGSGMAQGAGVHKLVLNLVNSHSGTLLWQRSGDRGTTWTTVDTEAIAAPSAGTSNTYEGLIEPFLDFRLVWTNGGSAQTTWVVDMALIDDRGAAS
jgi:hypothetical protein